MITKTQYIELMKQYQLIPFENELGRDYGVKSGNDIEWLFGYRENKPKYISAGCVLWTDGCIVL